MSRKYSKEDVQYFVKISKDKIDQIKESNVQDLIKHMIEPYSRRLDEISELCKLSKFKIYFIGKVGVGKSTAISHVTGLVDLIKLKEKVGEFRIDDIVLLKSASGRTTLCETVIKHSENDKTSIIVEEMLVEDFNKLVEDFCSITLEKDLNYTLPEEVYRVIKNMSDCPIQLSKKEKDSIKKNRDENKEAELKLIKEKQLAYVKKVLGDTEDFYDEQVYKKKFNEAILKSIDYKSRDQTIFIQNEHENIFEWLQKIYQDINYGKIIECPYPKRIIITLNKLDIETVFPSYVSEIIDTKGIDGSGVRDDIQEIIKSKDSILIFCDDIPGFGSIFQTDWLVSSLKSSQNVNYRSFILGLERNRELKNTNGSDGDRLEGMEIKKEELKKQYRKVIEETSFLDANINFYNALCGVNYDSDSLIIDFKDEEYQKERMYLKETIEKSIKDMYHELTLEVKKIEEKLNILKENHIDEVLASKLNKCKKEILIYSQEIENVHSTSIDKLVDRLKKIHASSVRGSVNRNGKHTNCNVYSECNQIGNDIFNTNCSEKRYAFNRFLQAENLFSDDIEIENAIKEAVVYKMNQLYNDFETKMSDSYKSITEKNIYESKFWAKVRLYWGDGNTEYRNRVIKNIIDEIKTTKTIEEIERLEYTKLFFEELYDFINVGE